MSRSHGSRQPAQPRSTVALSSQVQRVARFTSPKAPLEVTNKSKGAIYVGLCSRQIAHLQVVFQLTVFASSNETLFQRGKRPHRSLPLFACFSTLRFSEIAGSRLTRQQPRFSGAMANAKQEPAAGEQWDEAQIEQALKRLKDLHIQAS